ncbi:MAG: transcriptional repressor [Phycisphaerales bacterium]|nr:MAG: transcriptional repressor [Phycisphaerales bacterium]
MQLSYECGLILFPMEPGLLRNRKRLLDFERLCRDRGLSLTIQRRTVLEALLEGKDHPTADEIRGDVQRRIPGLSRTTVYRVLDTLVQLGVVNKIYQPGAPAVFDTGTHPHHHLACLSCNKIVDLENHLPSAPVPPDVRLKGLKILESHVFFRGTCRECLRKKARPRTGAGRARESSRAKPPRPKVKKYAAKRSKRKTST